VRKQVTVVLVGTLSFAVFVATGLTVAEQTADLQSLGLGVPNRNCTCPVRLDADFAQDAGLKLYQRLTMPCVRTLLGDGGIDVQLPPMPKLARQAIDVVDWSDCTLAADTAPVAATWGTARPFTSVAAASKPWCRQGPGSPCVGLDGGTMGDRNVGLCSLHSPTLRSPIGVRAGG
jgi:hypothetical protein